MKKNTLLISFITVLVLGVLLAGSIVIFDRENIKAEFSNNTSLKNLNFNDDILNDGKAVASKEINEDIKKINSNRFDLALVIKQGEPRVEVMSMVDKEVDLDKILEYTVKDGTLNINTKDNISVSEFPFNKYAIAIYLEDMSDLDVEINELDGVLSVEDDMKTMKITSVDGVLNLNGRLEKLEITSVDGVINIENDLSYDISINEIDGVGNINFDFMNAKIKLDYVDGLVKVMDTPLNIFDDEKSYNRTFGEGLNTIEIGTIDGIFNID